MCLHLEPIKLLLNTAAHFQPSLYAFEFIGLIYADKWGKMNANDAEEDSEIITTSISRCLVS